MLKRSVLCLTMMVALGMIAGCQETEGEAQPVEAAEPDPVSAAPEPEPAPEPDAAAEKTSTHPAIFSDLSYEEATAQATDQGRILLVDFTAEWCKWCKVLDKTTWVDEKVIAWIDEHAIILQIDVDKQKDLARKQLGVGPLPTVIAFRDGEEIDRKIGHNELNTEAALAWFASLPAE